MLRRGHIENSSACDATYPFSTYGNSVRFCEPRILDKHLKNHVFWHLYPKATNPTYPFSRKYVVYDDPQYCTLFNAQLPFYKRKYLQRRNSFPKNGVMGFWLSVLVSKTYLSEIFI